MKIVINSIRAIRKKDIKLLINFLNSDLNLQLDYLCIHLLSDEEILDINKKYLNHNFYTDIITFDLRDELSKEAELYLSIDRIKENAGANYTSTDEELRRVCIHGLLHLSGVNDKTKKQKKQMTELENKYLQKMFHVKP